MDAVEERTGGVTVLAVLYGIAAAWWLVAPFPFALTLAFLFRGMELEWLRLPGLALAIMNIVVATGLIALERWSWIGAIVIAAFDLLAIPFGTAIGIAALILLREPEVRIALGRRAPPPYAPIVPPPLLRHTGSGRPSQYPGQGPVSQPTVRDGAQTQSSPAVGRCGSCGAPAHPEDAFCGKCGAAAR